MTQRDLWAGVVGALLVGGALWALGMHDASAAVSAVSGFFVAKLVRLWLRKWLDARLPAAGEKGAD